MPPASPPAAFALYATIRAVGPPDAPFEGRLARAPDGGTVMLVDRDLLADWPGWRAPDDGHVMAPQDVLRRADGHDVILPVTPLRADRFVAHRAGTGVPLVAGEVVTMAISIVRGMATAIEAGLTEATASWWLTGEGKPLLVSGCGEADAARASAELMLLLAGSAEGGLADPLREVGDALGDLRTYPRRVEHLEAALFAVAAPEPITLRILGPTRAEPTREMTLAGANDARASEPTEPSLWQRLTGAADGGVAAAVWDAVHRVRRRSREARRVRPVWLAAGAAALVLTVGLAWPDDTAPQTAAGAPSPPATALAVDPSAAQTPIGPAPPTEPVAALTSLLAARQTCTDAACRAETQEDPAAVYPDGAVQADSPVITLLDDFGGLAVLRVESQGATAQFATIVRTPSGWRIRDVFDAADPPS